MHTENYLSSMQAFPEVGEPSYVPEPFHADGVLLEQLEAFLNSSPSRPENSNKTRDAYICFF